jgi:hypothetical protein
MSFELRTEGTMAVKVVSFTVTLENDTQKFSSITEVSLECSRKRKGETQRAPALVRLNNMKQIEQGSQSTPKNLSNAEQGEFQHLDENLIQALHEHSKPNIYFDNSVVPISEQINIIVEHATLNLCTVSITCTPTCDIINPDISFSVHSCQQIVRMSFSKPGCYKVELEHDNEKQYFYIVATIKELIKPVQREFQAYMEWGGGDEVKVICNYST